MDKTFFKSIEELKEVVSGMDISFDRKNLTTGSRRAAGYLKDIITPEIYKLALDHYHSSDYKKEQDPETLKDELVKHIQFVMGNLTMSYHFIWLQLRIGNDTISLTDKDNTPYKYQTDEAKNQLLETASEGINDLIDFLNDDHEGTTLNPWTESDQYKRQKNLLFENYRDFDQHFGIDHSAAFYIKARSIIQEVIQEHIVPRAGKIEDLGFAPDDTLKTLMKKAAAHLTIGEACIRMDYFFLPMGIRGQIDNEYKKKNSSHQTYVQENLGEMYRAKGRDMLGDIDLYRAQKDKLAADLPYKKFESIPNASDKHVSML